MKEINLREYYPEYYKSDYIVEVPDEVLEVFEEADRRENSYQRKRFRHKAHYSLDCKDGIEHSVLRPVLTPEKILEQQEELLLLGEAIAALPERQARRLRAHYLAGKRITEIAAEEKVHWSQVSRSIKKALLGITVYLKNNQ